MADSGIFYVTGPLHSGKTTRLRQWSEGRKDVGGVFQPVLGDHRYLIDIRTGCRMLLDAAPNEEEAYTIGKYRFAIAAFAWASNILEVAIQDADTKYLIVDEVGPLEMQGKGLDPILVDLLESPIPGISIVIVVREHMLEEVLVRYGVKEVAVEFGY